MQLLSFRSGQGSGCLNRFDAAREMTNHKKPVCARHRLVHRDTELQRKPACSGFFHGLCCWVLAAVGDSACRVVFKPQ